MQQLTQPLDFGDPAPTTAEWQPPVGDTWLHQLPREASVLRADQVAILQQAADAMLTYRRICIQASTGFGKCWGAGTPILMFDGTTRLVEDVAVGDVLMGPNSMPRTVLSLAHGEEMMYRVIPTKGDAYTVNESHILSLKVTPHKKGLAHEIINISVADYLKQNRTFKHRAKGWRTGVDWPHKEVPLNPYFLGIWLGDGDIDRVALSKPDEEVLMAFEKTAHQYGLSTSRDVIGTKCPRIRAARQVGTEQANPIYKILRKLGVTDCRHVPQIYLSNSREVRLQVLAGLLDTDGHMRSGGFDFISKSEELAYGVAFLCRSLGLAAYIKICSKGCQNNFVGRYYRITISGNCDVIPTRIERKKSPPRRQIKNHLVHGIKIEKVGIDNYYGFELDGDGLLLLSDFTVNHNTHCFSAIAGSAEQAGLSVLIIATRTKLVRQIHERLNSFNVKHGVIAAKMPGYRNMAAKVQVASADTLYRRCVADKRMPLPPASVVIFDEAHLALGASRQAILDSYPQATIFGFTATPAKTSGASLRDQFDFLILGPPPSVLIEAGTLVKPLIYCRPVMTKKELGKVKTDTKTGDYISGSAAKLMAKPKLIGNVVANWLRLAKDDRTLVFACDKSHGAKIVEEFLKNGVAAELLTDTDDEGIREAAIARLEEGDTKVIVNCFLLAYGVDIPRVECIVLARPTKSLVLYLQAVGRGMRSFPGKTHMKLIDHGRVFENLGDPTYDRDWSLDDSNVNEKAASQVIEGRIAMDEKSRECPECQYSWLVSEEGNDCKSCGWKYKPRPKDVASVDADLEQINSTLAPVATLAEFYQQSCHFYALRWPDKWLAKENSGRYWAWCQTRTRFKRPQDERLPPSFWKLKTVPCSPEVHGWLKSQLIRYAKRQAAQQAPQNA